ncbi:hypothetical protein E3T37_16175 [Cryobacterium sp. TMT2-10]|uniref:hypothetical protein n=1 Tax=Cryobacterium sp. TMT2-10 TaxID=1259244 RepID=UPI00106C7405|nr:hypothetical protein [Cryobacterium sp. TMT2-10]TFD34992.1 hypothetical protein E3T37_16175 [Cryobacterium sp. TMT2-10]
MRFEQLHDDRKAKRETFARYLNSALVTYDVVSSSVRREAAKNPLFRSSDALRNRMFQSPEWKLFNVHFGEMLFLLDDEGVKTLNQFGPDMMAAAIAAGVGKPQRRWDEQISGVLAAMRRSLE